MYNAITSYFRQPVSATDATATDNETIESGSSVKQIPVPLNTQEDQSSIFDYACTSLTTEAAYLKSMLLPLPDDQLSGTAESSTLSHAFSKSTPAPDDHSHSSFKDIMRVLTSESGRAWSHSLSQALVARQRITMPGMEKTASVIETFITEWEQYPELTDDDRDGLQIFKQRLKACREHAFEFLASEQLAHCFTYLHGLMTVRHPPQCHSDTNHEAIEQLKSAFPESVSVKNIIELPWQDYQHNERFISVQTKTLGVEAPYYLNLLTPSNWPRIISFAPLTVKDFNLTSGLPMVFVGLLKTFSARHDYLTFNPISFPWHDHLHAIQRYKAFQTLARKHIKGGASLSNDDKRLTDEMQRLMRHTHQAISIFESESSKNGSQRPSEKLRQQL